MIVVVAGGTSFSEKGPTNSLASGLLNLSSSQITLSLNLDTPLRLFIYRYAENFSISQLQTKLANQTLDDGAIDYGVTDNFTISSASNIKELSLTVQLQRETTFLDSAVQGLNYTTGGRSATTDQDGLLFYFPDEAIELKLSEISLGSFTNPSGILTPYSIMGVTEGTPTDNVTNLVRLLLSLDSDSDADNGIQLNTNQFNNLSGLSLTDFNVDNLSFASSKVPGLKLPSVQKAQKHLSRTMRQKNLATAGSGLSSPLPVPLNGEQGVPANGSIGLAFAENLRSSSISASSLVLTNNHTKQPVAGTVSVKRNWLLFKPLSHLNQNMTYQATAAAGLRSQSGQQLLHNYSWSFTTGNNTSNKFPRVIQKEPRDNASGVARNTIPTLTFEGLLFEGTKLQFELRYSGNQSLVSCSPSLWAASVH
ncbi:MAG: Ig-like domain-containing protein, partial [SAR324 cluster bacterium]|nr:Ig-like domain-containing protein [SAR324 cluster bacterium]